MVSSAARTRTLVRALQGALRSDTQDISQLYTDDVKVWAPAMSAASADELTAEFARRDEAFSAIELDVSPLDVAGDYACAEWSVRMTHSDTLSLADGTTIEATGLRVTVNGVMVAEFRGDRICAVRQYWDELSLLEQLGVARHG
jgi:ketosteroid isomerase-like protein